MSTVSKFISTKTIPSEGPFTVGDIAFTDNALQGVTFLALDGSVAFRVHCTSYTVCLQIPAPPVMVKRTKISATNETLKVTLPDEFFENSWDVTDRKRDLSVAGFTVTTEEVEIPEPAA